MESLVDSGNLADAETDNIVAVLVRREAGSHGHWRVAWLFPTKHPAVTREIGNHRRRPAGIDFKVGRPARSPTIPLLSPVDRPSDHIGVGHSVAGRSAIKKGSATSPMDAEVAGR